MKKLLIAAFVFVLLLFGVYVWPTQWKYVDTKGGSIIRVHRMSGEAQRLTTDGWIALQPEDSYFSNLPVE